MSTMLAICFVFVNVYPANLILSYDNEFLQLILLEKLVESIMIVKIIEKMQLL